MAADACCWHAVMHLHAKHVDMPPGGSAMMHPLPAPMPHYGSGSRPRRTAPSTHSGSSRAALALTHLPLLLQLVVAKGQLIAAGLLATLLAPSPLPRVHKVCTILQDLALMLQLPAAAAIAAAGPAMLPGWLSAGAQTLPAGAVDAAEAQAVVADWSALLVPAGGARPGEAPGAAARMTAARSYTTSKRLKKHVREFAEMHSRQ
jgi:hypothetical protein